MEYLDRIQVDSLVCQGAAHIQGTRIMVSVVLDALSEGHSVDWILSQYPSLTADDVHAAIASRMGLGGAGRDTAIASF